MSSIISYWFKLLWLKYITYYTHDDTNNPYLKAICKILSSSHVARTEFKRPSDFMNLQPLLCSLNAKPFLIFMSFCLYRNLKWAVSVTTTETNLIHAFMRNHYIMAPQKLQKIELMLLFKATFLSFPVNTNKS